MTTNSRYIIAEIGDKDFDPEFVPPANIDDYKVRKASRGVLIRNGKIALLFVTKQNYHKLPGGGIESNESTTEAYVREIGEETGCGCKIVENKNQNSVVIETRDQFKLLQISYIFYSEVVGEPKEVKFTDEEKSEGFKVKWVAFDEAVELISNDKPYDYEGKFIQKRDLAVLNFYRELVG